MYYENLRPVQHYKDLYATGNDPWGPDGGTYDDPVVTRDDANVYYLYRDGTGRPWIEIYDGSGGAKYLTSDDFDHPSHWGIPGLEPLTYIWSGDGGPIQGAWRSNEEGEEPVGRVESHVDQSPPPLEETTPLFGPADHSQDAQHDPAGYLGHWDPVGLRWVDDGPPTTSVEGRAAAGHDVAGPLDQAHPNMQHPNMQGGIADAKGPPPGHWDPAGLRWVPDEPTSSVGRSLDQATPHLWVSQTQQPTEGSPTPDSRPSVDPAVPFNQDTTPTSVEGTAAARVNVDPSSLGAGGEGGTAGTGVPYQDYIPFYPMVQDTTTGQWRNAEPGEFSGPEGSESTAPGSPHMLSHLSDPSTPGPTLDPALFDHNAPGPTLDPALFDHNAPGPTIDPSLLDPAAPGPTLNPALLDSTAPGPTIDHALLDPGAPGATINPSVLDSNWPGPTLDPNQLDPSAPGPTLDPAQLEHDIAHPGASYTEPAGVTDHPGFTEDHQGFMDPSLTEVGHHEPSMPAHDLDDPSALG